MKYSVVLLSLIIILSVTFSCSKKSDNTNIAPTPVPDTSNYMSCTLRGISWKTNSTTAELIYDTIGNLRDLGIYGWTKNEMISCGFQDQHMYQQMPTATLLPNTALFDYQPIVAGDTIADYFTINGNLKITVSDSLKKTVSGYFECTEYDWGLSGLDTVVIKNGYFKNVHYTIIYE